MPLTRSVDEMTQVIISAGETLVDMADYWMEATAEERRDIVWSLFPLDGLISDLEHQSIIGLLPRESILPVLTLGLEQTERWGQRDQGLWLCSEYLPPKRECEDPHLPPPQPSSLTPEQRREALVMVEQGMSLRGVARHFGTLYESIRRLLKKEGSE